MPRSLAPGSGALVQQRDPAALSCTQTVSTTTAITNPRTSTASLRL